MSSFFIKKKIIALEMSHGKKNMAEKNFVKSVKLAQILLAKKARKNVGLSIIGAIPIFKLHQKFNKKQKSIKNFSRVVFKERNKIAFAIKSIFCELKNYKSVNFSSSRLVFLWVLSIANKNVIVEAKNALQQKALLKKRLFFSSYRWQ